MGYREILARMPKWTKEDFDEAAPYDYINQYRDNAFQLKVLEGKLAEYASSVGVKDFVKRWTLYRKEVMGEIDDSGLMEFSEMEKTFRCGKYTCNDNGVYYFDTRAGQTIEVCTHPIYPKERLTNIDSGTEKIKLAFKRGADRPWREIIVDKETVASSSQIVSLCAQGIAVTSENAKYLVKYLADVEALNYDEMKELKSVSRLGWCRDNGFSPYVDDVIFDGDISFSHMFKSVRAKGSRELWLDTARKVRVGSSIAPRIMLAASFASALVQPVGGLPFFVHAWDATETGKTVGLMLATSVWADPFVGEYIHTFNSTAVSQELTAGFCNSLPLCIDELMIAATDRSNFDHAIYTLTEGVGKGRGAKGGGLQKKQTWRNCVITTGERPITNPDSCGGAVNRILEVHCGGRKMFEDARTVANTLVANYGWAGRDFIRNLTRDGQIDRAKRLFDMYSRDLLNRYDTTEKQAMAGALVLTADALATEWVFKDGRALTRDDVGDHLTQRMSVDANRRAYDWIKDWIGTNPQHFFPDSFTLQYSGEIWGMVDVELEKAYIVSTVFNREMQRQGYNATAFLAWAKANDVIQAQSDGKAYSIVKKIAKTPTRCICLKIPTLDTEEIMKKKKLQEKLEAERRNRPGIQEEMVEK